MFEPLAARQQNVFEQGLGLFLDLLFHLLQFPSRAIDEQLRLRLRLQQQVDGAPPNRLIPCQFAVHLVLLVEQFNDFSVFLREQLFQPLDVVSLVGRSVEQPFGLVFGPLQLGPDGALDVIHQHATLLCEELILDRDSGGKRLCYDRNDS